jgi:hypothetical protein
LRLALPRPRAPARLGVHVAAAAPVAELLIDPVQPLVLCVVRTPRRGIEHAQVARAMGDLLDARFHSRGVAAPAAPLRDAEEEVLPHGVAGRDDHRLGLYRVRAVDGRVQERPSDGVRASRERDVNEVALG